jgi:hypothetical protein
VLLKASAEVWDSASVGVAEPGVAFGGSGAISVTIRGGPPSPARSPSSARPSGVASSPATHSQASSVNAVKLANEAAARLIAIVASIPCTNVPAQHGWQSGLCSGDEQARFTRGVGQEVLQQIGHRLRAGKGVGPVHRIGHNRLQWGPGIIGVLERCTGHPFPPIGRPAERSPSAACVTIHPGRSALTVSADPDHRKAHRSKRWPDRGSCGWRMTRNMPRALPVPKVARARLARLSGLRDSCLRRGVRLLARGPGWLRRPRAD